MSELTGRLRFWAERYKQHSYALTMTEAASRIERLESALAALIAYAEQLEILALPDEALEHPDMTRAKTVMAFPGYAKGEAASALSQEETPK